MGGFRKSDTSASSISRIHLTSRRPCFLFLPGETLNKERLGGIYKHKIIAERGEPLLLPVHAMYLICFDSGSFMLYSSPRTTSVVTSPIFDLVHVDAWEKQPGSDRRDPHIPWIVFLTCISVRYRGPTGTHWASVKNTESAYLNSTTEDLSDVVDFIICMMHAACNLAIPTPIFLLTGRCKQSLVEAST